MIPFFPGKFQPPHLGHILTISKIIDEYNFLIVGLTDDGERVMTKNDICNIFTQIFKDKVFCVFIKGKLVDQNGNCVPLKYDILLSGNDEVISWAKKHNIKTRNVVRSEGIGFSGVELRGLLGNR